MIVCICHRVSDRDIARAVGQGCTSFDALQDELRVATACGACADCAHDCLHASRQAISIITIHKPRACAHLNVSIEALLPLVQAA
jgi:bacterioferritin-associated ferredoxin